MKTESEKNDINSDNAKNEVLMHTFVPPPPPLPSPTQIRIFVICKLIFFILLVKVLRMSLPPPFTTFNNNYTCLNCDYMILWFCKQWFKQKWYNFVLNKLFCCIKTVLIYISNCNLWVRFYLSYDFSWYIFARHLAFMQCMTWCWHWWSIMLLRCMLSLQNRLLVLF